MGLGEHPIESFRVQVLENIRKPNRLKRKTEAEVVPALPAQTKRIKAEVRG